MKVILKQPVWIKNDLSSFVAGWPLYLPDAVEYTQPHDLENYTCFTEFTDIPVPTLLFPTLYDFTLDGNKYLVIKARYAIKYDNLIKVMWSRDDILNCPFKEDYLLKFLKDKIKNDEEFVKEYIDGWTYVNCDIE